MDILINVGLCLFGALLLFGGLYLWLKILKRPASSLTFEATIGTLAELVCCLATGAGFGAIIMGLLKLGIISVTLSSVVFALFAGFCGVAFFYDRGAHIRDAINHT